MDHELLYRLYGEAGVEEVRQYQDFVDLFPPVDSRVALEYWEAAGKELEHRKRRIREQYPNGDTLADVAARATREQAFTALDLASKYGRSVNVLVLDVDETLRSAASTDNEIPRETLHLLTELHEAGMPIVICTGQTLENVKGFAIQGLGSAMVHSGALSIVYEGGTGVFTPGHGTDTKQLLYEQLGESVQGVFEQVRSSVLSGAPATVRRGCHLQGNEFNVTLKPNYETGSDRADKIVDTALVYLLSLLGEAVADQLASGDAERAVSDAKSWTKAYYADADPEIRTVLRERDSQPEANAEDLPSAFRDVLSRIDVGYYEADAAEITSLELNKVEGVKAAFEVLGVADPFSLVMGDSKSDLRVMRWVYEEGRGIAAAPSHASADVLAFVEETDGLVFEEGNSARMLRTVYALNRLALLA